MLLSRRISVRSIENNSNFLKCRTSGFHKEEVHNRDDASNPDTVVDVPVPANVFQRNGVDIVTKDLRSLDDQKNIGPSFGSHLICNNLKGIGHYEVEPSDGIESLEKEDTSDDEAACSDRALIDILLGGDSPCDEDNQ